VTIDTEGDDEWTFRRHPSAENIAHLRALEGVLERVGAVATYLVTHSVAEDPRAADTLRSLREERGAELGAHCHAWNTPPVEEPEGAQVFLNELPGAVQRRKLETLTETLERRLGVRPRSFRAGRFGANAATLRCLAELGYTVDSSVTPGVTWRGTPGLPGGEGGPDYRDAPLSTYFPDREDPTRPGRPGPLLEVPVTVVRTRRLPAPAHRVVTGFGPGSLLSAVAGKLGLGKTLWLYPVFETAEDLVKAAEVAVRQGADVLNLMLHSSEVMPGGSPYLRTAADVQALLGRTERALETVIERTGAVPCTLTGVPRPAPAEEAEGAATEEATC